MFRSSSSVSSRSSKPPDIINEEDEILEINFDKDPMIEINRWRLPKIGIDSLYDKTWREKVHLTEFNVKTVERTFAISKTQEKCRLFQRDVITDMKKKDFSFIHIASVQVAIKPLIRKGVNASVLLCLRDAGFRNFDDSQLEIVQTSLAEGPVHFDCYPDLTIDLNDKNILDVLTLNILTFGIDMTDGSKPLALIYRIYYRLMKTSLNPKAKLHSSRDQTLLMQSSSSSADIRTPKMINWKDVSFPDEWVLPQELPPRQVMPRNKDVDLIQQYLDGTVKISFDRPSTTKERRYSFTGPLSSTSSDPRISRDRNLETFLEDSVKMAEPKRPITIQEIPKGNSSESKLKGVSS